ncbi:MAG: hypothetical protein M3323_08305 [Actinomycetota bacterium]|nr:hypothetical protein [Actinomycetota bacterium]
MKLSKTRSILVSAAAAAVAIVPFAPAQAAGAPIVSPVQADVAYGIDGAHVAIGTCEGVGTTTGRSLKVTWTGTAKATGAIAVGIMCGVVQDGYVVASSSHALPGSAGATAGSDDVAVKEYSMCANVFAVFTDGRIVEQNNCP